ncbi:MAG: hypothetical protein ACD_63C00170G0004 [uncultured bacterium]|nr:MAG: hypothetical protein ACD_63C00170G0004 [uncultured bacterium]
MVKLAKNAPKDIATAILAAAVITAFITVNDALAGEKVVTKIEDEITVVRKAQTTNINDAFANTVSLNKNIEIEKSDKVTSPIQTASLVAEYKVPDKPEPKETMPAQPSNKRKIARAYNAVPRANTRAVQNNGTKPANGYCTAWASAKTGWVDWRGNANAWSSNAAANGHKVGKEYLAEGAIAVTNGGPYGHVAYVEKIENDQVTISEQNWNGYGVKSTRTMHKDDPRLKTFIQK